MAGLLRLTFRSPGGLRASRGPGARHRPAARSRRRATLSRTAQRDRDREGGASAGRVLRPDLAPVLLHDLVADGQPQPGALADRLGRVERIEDAAEALGRDARAGVADRD